MPRWLVVLVIWAVAFFDPGRWAVWHFRATIVNDGAASGNHTYEFTPGAGNIVILLGGRALNGDLSSRNMTISLRNTDDDLIRSVLRVTGVAAGGTRDFPTSQGTGDSGTASVPPEVVVAGTESLFVDIASLAVSENTEVSLQMLVFGGPPTVVLTSPAGATETETENRIV